jgi:S1-C subfamily serine protease
LTGKQILIVLGVICLIAAPAIALLAYFEVFPFDGGEQLAEDEPNVILPDHVVPPPGGFIDPALRDEILEEARRRREEMLAPPKEEDLAQQKEEIRRAMRANVQLAVQSPFGESQGSGVVLQIDGEDCLIITNRHVIRGGEDFPPLPPPAAISGPGTPKVEVFYVTGDKVEGDVVWTAEGADLALVRAPCPSQGVEEAPWRMTPSVHSGERVFAIGNPSGLGWTYTSGEVSALRTNGQVPIVQTDAAINPGNSGGGLYNAKGELIAINTSIVNPNMAQNLGFAIRASYLKDLAPPMLKLAEEPESSDGSTGKAEE